MSTAAIYAIFFLSGAAGLVYQVVWVREFGNLFGNTVYSAAIVTAVFMGGLGVGGAVVGRWSDRIYRGDVRRPLRAYGLFELGIAASGFSLALVLPRLEVLSAAAATYRIGPEGWHEVSLVSLAMVYVVAVVALAPITFLMGGTLTLLIRYLVTRDLSLAGRRIGALYGVNTLGAAFGAFFSDFALIPALGIFQTQLAAVSVNALAGLAVLALAARLPPPAFETVSEPEANTRLEPSALAYRRVSYTSVTLFLSGFAAMGMEIVWFRYLISVIGPYRAVFSLLLTVILVGICVGSVLGGLVHRRLGGAARLYIGMQALFVPVTLVCLSISGLGEAPLLAPDLKARYAEATSFGRLLIETSFTMAHAVFLAGLPALLMGFTFPLANAHVQRLESRVGRRSGTLYLANTLGNIAGLLATGFFLLPQFGAQTSVTVLAGCTLAALFPLYATVRGSRAEHGEASFPPPLFAGAVGMALLGLAWWISLPSNHLISRMLPRTFLPGQVFLAVSEGVNETVAVTVSPQRERRLYTNGHSMSSTNELSRRYMRLLAHLPLVSHDEPKRALVIGFGVGLTAHAASLHASVERVDVVDLSKNVVRHHLYFRNANGRVLESPKVSVFINDGRQHLRMQPPECYDLITAEPPPLTVAGVASLYSVEFYRLARSRLSEGGLLTQWLPAYQVSEESVRSLVRSFVDVFPASVLLHGGGRELILMGIKGDSLELELGKAWRRIVSNPRLLRDLQRIGVESPLHLVGVFAASAQTLQTATRDVRPVTDDHPIIEYDSRSHLTETRLPSDMFAVSGVVSWCPRCFRNGQPMPGIRDLAPLLREMDAVYRSESFLRFSNVRGAAQAM